MKLFKEHMQLFNICTKKEYEKNGQKKIKWYKVGVLKIADSGKQYIRLFHQPTTELFVFDRNENLSKDETITNQ